MLDTDICSYIMKQHPLKTLQKMQRRVQEGKVLCISVITYAELVTGAQRSNNPDKYHRLIDEFCERLDNVASWDKAAADNFARIQTYLLNKGIPIGHNDTMIAAHSVSNGAVLVSNNSRHFKRVPGINLENWG